MGTELTALMVQVTEGSRKHGKEKLSKGTAELLQGTEAFSCRGTSSSLPATGSIFLAPPAMQRSRLQCVAGTRGCSALECISQGAWKRSQRTVCDNPHDPQGPPDASWGGSEGFSWQPQALREPSCESEKGFLWAMGAGVVKKVKVPLLPWS